MLPFLKQAAPMLQMLGGLGMVWLQQRIYPGSTVAMPGMAIPGMPGLPAMPAIAGVPAMPVPAMPGVPAMMMPMPGVPTATTPATAYATQTMPSFVPSAAMPTAPAATTVVASMPAAITQRPVVDARVTIDRTDIDDELDEAADMQARNLEPAHAQAASTAATLPTTVPASNVANDPLAHIKAIGERLDPEDATYAHYVIASMDPARQAQWMAALSTMSLDDATAAVRTAIAQLRGRTP